MATIATFTGSSKQKKQKQGKKQGMQVPPFPGYDLYSTGPQDFSRVPVYTGVAEANNWLRSQTGAPVVKQAVSPTTTTTGIPATAGKPATYTIPPIDSWSSQWGYPTGSVTQTTSPTTSTAGIYNTPAAATTATGWQPAQGIPWASTNEYARYQQAVSGYTNSANTQIPGIPGMSFLDWYYQLGGRIRPGMTQGEANYIAAREAPYAKMRERIDRFQRGGQRRRPNNSEPNQGTEAVPQEIRSLNYSPATTNWRIG